MRSCFSLRSFASVLLLCCSLVAGAQPVVTKSSEGTDFWLTFPPNYGYQVGEIEAEDQLSFVVAARTAATVEIVATPPKATALSTFRQTYSLSAGEQRIIKLPKEFAIASNATSDDKWGIDEDSIRITSTTPVAVYGRNRVKFTTDGYLGLPISSLGTDYVAAAYVPSLFSTQIKVLATEDSTTVTLKLTENTTDADGLAVPAKTTKQLLLQRGQTLYVAATPDANSVKGGDLTGSTIYADKPIAVFSGNRCTLVPIDRLACDHLVEMLPPVTTLGSSFLIVPTVPNDAIGWEPGRARIIAAADNTTVYRSGYSVGTLARGEWIEIKVESPENIQTSRPALAMQYLAAQARYGDYVSRGDPSMMTVVPTAQFLDSYQVSTYESPPVPPDTINSVRIQENFLQVVIPTGAIPSISLDGASVNPSLFFPVPRTAFSYATIPVSLGTHRIEASLPFGLYASGMGNWESYAYPGGMAMNSINDLTDPFPPNARLVQVGDVLQGLATDSSDLNANGILDAEEQMWGPTIGPRAEDTNRNSQLDAGEDVNGNGRLDRDLGLQSIQLAPDSVNLVLDVASFTPGTLAVPFTVRKSDPMKDGIGGVVITDVSGNRTTVGASLSNGLVIRNVRVLEVVSNENLVVELDSFATPPGSVRALSDRYEIEWNYPQASSLSALDLSYDVTFKSPIPSESRVVSRRTTLQYDDAAGNTVSYEIGPKSVAVLGTPYELTATLDKRDYVLTENGKLSASLSHLGLGPFPSPVCARVIDQAGVTVNLRTANGWLPSQGLYRSGAIPPGETRPLIPSPLELRFDGLLVGAYTVEVNLVKPDAFNCVAAESVRTVSIPFNVTSVPGSIAVDSTLQLDRATYQPSDRVLANSVVRNLLGNGIATGFSVRIQTMRPNGTMFATITRAVPQLVPLNQWANEFSFALRNEVPGIYTTIAQLLDDAGGVVETRTAKFSVLSTAVSGSGLTGTLATSPKQVRAGETLAITGTATNLGNAAISAVPLTIYVIDPDAGVVVKSFNQTSSIAQSASVQFNATWAAQGTPNKTYLVVLSATIGTGIDATSLTLAEDVYQLLPQIPASIVASAGTPQTRTLGQPYSSPIEATVLDTVGNAIANAVVSFTAPSAGASVSFSSGIAGPTPNVVTAITDASGKASITVVANNIAGGFDVRATTDGVSGSAVFSLRNAEPVTYVLSAVSGAPQSSTVTQAYTQPLKVLVKDSLGQPVSGVRVTYDAPINGASVLFPQGNSVLTDALGGASLVVVANGVAGALTVAASAPGVNGTANFALTNLAPVAATIAVVGGTPQSATITQPYGIALQAVVRDNFGQVMSGVEVVFAAPSSGASVTFVGGNRSTTDGSGVARAQIVANAVSGAFLVTATTSGASGGASFNLQNLAAVAASITAAAGTPQSTLVTKDYATALKALVKDNLGNPMPGVVVTFTPPTGVAVASVTFPSGNTAVTGTDGAASVSARANAVTGNVLVTATVPNLATSATFSLTNLSPVPTTIVATAGTPQSSTVTMAYPNQLEATVKDTLGNPSAGVLVTFASPVGPSIASATFPSGATAATDGQGKARVSVSANAVAGSFSVTATAAAVSGSAAFSLTNVAPTTSSISATAGTPQSAVITKDFPAALQATVKDNIGNPVSGALVTFTAPMNGASATFPLGATSTTNALGQASVTVRANATTGVYQVTASTNGVSGTASFALTNLAPLPSSIAATGGTPQTTTITTQYAQQLEATVLDSLGGASVGTTVTFAAPTTPGAASVTFPAGNTAVTDAQGKARVAVRADATTGVLLVIASVNGVAGDARFSLTNSAATVSTIVATAGTPQTARFGTAFALPLVATVRDTLGAVVSGVTVTFAAPTAGATATFPSGSTAVTNAAGQASAIVQANGVAGSFSVTASAPGATGNANFQLTNTATCQPANTVAFAATTGAPLNTVMSSNVIVISGLGVGCTANASVTGGSIRVIRAGLNVTKSSIGFSTQPQSVQDGDQITLEQTSSAQHNTKTTATLTLDGVPYVWSLTTQAQAVTGELAVPIPMFPENQPWRGIVLALLALLMAILAKHAIGIGRSRRPRGDQFSVGERK